MIDLIPGIQFSDTEKQVYGTVGAALLGALIGTITSFLIANRERQKQDDAQNIALNRNHIRENALALHTATLTLTDILVKNGANREYVSDIKKGLVKQDGEKRLALMQTATPFLYPSPDQKLVSTILNDKIITLWGNLITEVELQNKNISDFADFYAHLFTTIHTALLKNEQLDHSIVESDSISISKGMDSQMRANDILRNKTLDLRAYLDCFVEHLKLTDTRKFKTLREYRQHIEQLANFEPDDLTFAKARADAVTTYNPETMFRSSSTGDQVIDHANAL